MLGVVDFALCGAAAMAAGTVNALAGGGTLISFPTMTAVGIPSVAANVTNTVALCPGMFGGIMAQPDVDGALVGGASLDADEFGGVCRFYDMPTL